MLHPSEHLQHSSTVMLAIQAFGTRKVARRSRVQQFRLRRDERVRYDGLMVRLSSIRRLVQFRLATLLVLITVSSGWLGYRVNLAQRQQAAVRTLRESGAAVRYNEEPGLYFTHGEDTMVDSKLSAEMKAQQTFRSRLAEWFGIDLFYWVVDVAFYDTKVANLEVLSDLPAIEFLTVEAESVHDEGLVKISQLKNLSSLELHARGFTKEGFRHLNRLRRLRSLDLSGSDISDDYLRLLSDLKNLESIDLSDTNITNNGLVYLKQFPKLKILSLFRCKVGDDALASIRGLEQLESLFLNYTRVSDSGLQHLRGHGALRDLVSWLRVQVESFASICLSLLSAE